MGSKAHPTRAKVAVMVERVFAQAKVAASLVGEAGLRWSADSCYRLGASLAYAALFSIFPLLLLCITAFGFVLGDGDLVRERILSTITSGSSTEVRTLLDETLRAMQTQRTARGVGALAGVVALVAGASGVFSELEASLNLIWRVEAKPTKDLWSAIVASIRTKAISFAIVIVASLALFASLLMGTIVQTLGNAASRVSLAVELFPFLETALSLLVLTFLLACLYRNVPQRPLRWRDVLGGALIASLSFTALKGLLAWYLVHLARYSAYGAVGAVLGLLTWIYVASLVLLFGAEFGAAYARRFGSLANAAIAPSAPNVPSAAGT